MPKSFIDKDRGWKKIMSKIRKTRVKSVSIGVRGQGTGKSDLATIALYHEKGGKRPGWKKGCPPKRSFIGPTIDQNQSKYMRALERIASRIAIGKINVKQGLFGLGSLVERHIKRKIRAGVLPQLAESTKKFKAKHGKPKNTPLIHHGRLINSITHWMTK